MYPTERTWNILLVDDDPDMLQAAHRALRRSPNLKSHVETAVGVEDALRILERCMTDIVVADYRMPPDNGAELLRRVGETTPEVTRVLVSDFGPDFLARRGVRTTDADLILTKDEMLRDLDRKLTEFLSRNAPE